MHRARTVGKRKLLAFAAFDSAKENYAVAVASLLAGDRDQRRDAEGLPPLFRDAKGGSGVSGGITGS